MKMRDLTGQRFGKLVALRPIRSEGGHWVWLWQCDCGNTCEARGRDVTRAGHAKRSCGCARVEAQAKIKTYVTPESCANRAKDLFGQQFGRLTAICPTEKRTKGAGHIIWYCVCSCGNEVLVPTNNLSPNHTSSCGCYHREIGREQCLKYNATRRALKSNSWLMMLGGFKTKKRESTRKHQLVGDRFREDE